MEEWWQQNNNKEDVDNDQDADVDVAPDPSIKEQQTSQQSQHGQHVSETMMEPEPSIMDTALDSAELPSVDGDGDKPWPPKPHIPKTDLHRWTTPHDEAGFFRAGLSASPKPPSCPQKQLSLQDSFSVSSGNSKDKDNSGASVDREVSVSVSEQPNADEECKEETTKPEPGKCEPMKVAETNMRHPTCETRVSSFESDDDDERNLPHVPASSTQNIPPAFIVKPHRNNRKLVNSLGEAFLLEEDMYDSILEEEDGDTKIANILHSLHEDSLSTAFSGVEAAATSANCLRHAWSKKTGVELGNIKPIHQIEWNSACLKEILPSARKNGTCVFENILQFFRPELKSLLQQCFAKPTLAVEILGPVLASGKAMTREGWCLVHKKKCVLHPAQRHIAGTSCRPYSKKGSQLGQVDPEIIFSLAWIGLRIELQEPEVLSENVRTVGQAGLSSTSAMTSPQRAPAQEHEQGTVCDAGLGNLFLRFLAPYYEMEAVVLDPTLFGFPFSREREFIKMTHRVKTQGQAVTLTEFQPLDCLIEAESIFV